MINIDDSFKKLLGKLFIQYRGCLIDPRKDGVYWAGKKYDSVDAAKNAIDRTCELVGEGINKLPANRLKK